MSTFDCNRTLQIEALETLYDLKNRTVPKSRDKNPNVRAQHSRCHGKYKQRDMQDDSEVQNVENRYKERKKRRKSRQCYVGRKLAEEIVFNVVDRTRGDVELL